MKKLLLFIATTAVLLMTGCQTQKIVNKGEAVLNQDIHVIWTDREVLISNTSDVTTYEVEFIGTKPYLSLQAPMKLVPGARWNCVMPDDILKAVVKTTLSGGKILTITLKKQQTKNKKTGPGGH